MKKRNLFSSLMATITFVVVFQGHQSYGQSFYAANNTDVSSRCYASGTKNPNNDYIESPLGSTKRSVIVYDGAHPGLFWDDGNGHTGCTLLGAGIPNSIVVNPDVSLMSTGDWAIAVQDTYNDYIMAELFKWDGSAF